MTNAFWTGGESALREGLKKHYGLLISQLREQADQIQDDLQKAENKAELDRVQSEFGNALKETDRLLF